MAGAFPGHSGMGMMIMGDFFIRQLPLSGNLNFPPRVPFVGPVKLPEKKSSEAFRLEVGKKEQRGACQDELE
jgi:hypothetical protein